MGTAIWNEMEWNPPLRIGLFDADDLASDARCEGFVLAVDSEELDREQALALLRPSPALPEPRVSPPAPSRAVPPRDASRSETLRIVGCSPHGRVARAYQLVITFSLPMTDPAAAGGRRITSPPARLEPQPPGTWRWIDACTLVFEPTAGRLAQATRFTLTVPAGVTAWDGARLPRSFRRVLITAPPSLRRAWPDERARPDALILLEFDQAVDREACAAAVIVTAAGKRLATRLAARERVGRDADATRHVKGLPQQVWVALEPVEPLPAASLVEVSIPAGLSSPEGPLTTGRRRLHRFRTQAPLQVTRVVRRRTPSLAGDWRAVYLQPQQIRLSPRAVRQYRGTACVPYREWAFEFTHPIDDLLMRADWVHVVPPVPFRFHFFDKRLVIEAEAAPGTTCEVRLSPDIVDVFGQSLGVEHRSTFRVAEAGPFLAPLGDLAQASASPRIAVVSAGHDALRVEVRRVTVDDFPAFDRDQYCIGLNARSLQRASGGRLEVAPLPPGPLVYSTVVPVDKRGIVTTTVDVAPALQADETGHLVVTVRPVAEDEEAVTVWLQVTRIGLFTCSDGNTLLCRVTPPRALRTNGATVDLRELGETSDSPRSQRIDPATGTAQFPLPSRTTRFLVVARSANDACLLSRYHWPDSRSSMELRWHTWTDRAAYRPGETIHLKGWLRQVLRQPGLDLEPVGDLVTQVTWELANRRERVVARGTVPVSSDQGSFHAAVPIPSGARPGTGQIRLKSAPHILGREIWIPIVARHRPRYDVSLEVPSGARIVRPADGHAPLRAVVAARDDTGAPLAAMDVTWCVYYRCITHETSGGFVTAPLRIDPHHDCRRHSARTDHGCHTLGLSLADCRLPVHLTVSVDTSDNYGRRRSEFARLVVLPADLCIGLRAQGSVAPGGTARVEALVTDWDGTPLPDRAFTLTVLEPTTGIHETRACVSSTTPLVLSFGVPDAPSAVVRGTVTDAHGRTCDAWLTLEIEPPRTSVHPDHATLIADMAEYSGSSLRPPLARQQLVVHLTTPEQPLAPGSEIVLSARVLDTSNQPIADAEVALAVVDEAALAVLRHEFPSPLDTFSRGSGSLLRSEAVLPDRTEQRFDVMSTLKFAYKDDAMRCHYVNPDEWRENPRLELEFGATPVFLPALRTDDKGSITVLVKLPDHATEWRVVAEAAHGARFGAAQAGFAVSSAGRAAREACADVQRLGRPETVYWSGKVETDSVVVPLDVQDADPSIGGLRWIVSSHPAGQFGGLVWRLLEHPHANCEHASSRLIGLLAVRGAWRALGLDETTILKKLRAAVRVVQRCHGGQGFGCWPGGAPDPRVTVHATHALLAARRAGLCVDSSTLGNALHGIARALDRAGNRGPRHWGAHAYGAWVLHQSGEHAPPGWIRSARCWTDVPLEACAWLREIVEEAERDEVQQRLESAARDEELSPMPDDEFGTSTAMTALVAYALGRAGRHRELVAQLLGGLSKASSVRRTRANTYDAALTLMAVGDAALEGQDAAEAAASLRLGGRLLIGANSSPHGAQGKCPIRALMRRASEPLVLERMGKRPQYFSLALSTLRPAAWATVCSHGFVVTRRFLPLAGGAVTRDNDGVWVVRMGSPVMVEVIVWTPVPRDHVALVDGLARCFSPVSHPRDERAADCFPAAHIEASPREVRAYAERLSRAGTYVFRHVVRVEATGVFTAPPPRVEQIYRPDCFGRGTSDRVVVMAPSVEASGG